MYEMNEKKESRRRVLTASKECAYLAVFVALVIAAQLCLSAIPGVEVVTLLFVVYAFSFGVGRGMLAATAFSLLRQLVFGFFPTVLLLYLLYYNLLTLLFGLLGKRIKLPVKWLWLLTLVACVCTAFFTFFDDILTPLWYGYTWKAAKAYFYASLSFMLPQIVCTGVTVGLLFLPLWKTFQRIKKRLL